jgi:hypothetical protein
MNAMNTPTTRRILRVAPLLAAVALSVGACATPWANGANASGTSTSSAANNAVTNNATTSDAANGSGPQPAAQPAPAAQNGVAAAAPGGAAGAPGAAASAPSGQSGFGGGPTVGAVATAGMSPDDVAQYCKLSGDFSAMGGPEELSTFYYGEAAKPLVDLKKHTPVQLQPDVTLLYTDYEALAKQTRVFPQVKDEVDASYKRVMDFNTQICQAH